MHPYRPRRARVAAAGLTIAAALALTVLPSAAQAQALFFRDQTGFNFANPGLTTEGFEKARVSSGAINLFDGPLSGSTNNAVFSPGEIVSGLSVRAEDDPRLLALGAGVVPGTGRSVSATLLSPYLIFSFNSAPGGGVNAAGLNLFATTGSPGYTGFATFTMTAYGVGGVNLGFQTIFAAPGVNPFLGVTSSSLITSIEVSAAGLIGDTSSIFVGADDISFGAAGLTLIPDRAAFNAANPGLPVADFESANAPDGQFLTFAGPLNSATDNGIFSPGAIPDGMSFNAGPSDLLNTASSGTVRVGGEGANFLPGSAFPGRALSSGAPLESLDFTYAAGASQIGMDLFSTDYTGTVTSGLIIAGVYSGDQLLTSVPVLTGLGQKFLGLQSTVAPITRVNLSNGAPFEFIDNVAVRRFSTVGATAPEPGTVALLSVGALALACVAPARRRTRRSLQR